MGPLAEESLKNSAVVLAIVTLLYVAIAELSMTERMRIMLVYIFASFLAFAGSFQLRYICIGALIVPFLVLEFLASDTKRLQLFTRPDYKLADFLYRMFLEYAYAYFVLAMAAIFVAHHWHYLAVTHALALFLAIVCIGMALLSLAAQKYSTRSITAISQRLETGTLTYEIDMTEHLQVMLEILASMEDQSYFGRTNHQHTLPFKRFVAKGTAYLRAHRGLGLPKAVRSLFSRGYGTIEMQLLRSIGIESGYRYTVRRKLFELLYANMLFNGYRAYLVRGNGDYSHYRAFIMLKYIENVDVSINGKKYRSGDGRSSLLQLFSRKDVAHVTKEEFFVWCLGLPQRPHIYPATLYYYSGLMHRFGIDREIVEGLVGNIGR